VAGRTARLEHVTNSAYHLALCWKCAIRLFETKENQVELLDLPAFHDKTERNSVDLMLRHGRASSTKERFGLFFISNDEVRKANNKNRGVCPEEKA